MTSSEQQHPDEPASNAHERPEGEAAPQASINQDGHKEGPAAPAVSPVSPAALADPASEHAEAASGESGDDAEGDDEDGTAQSGEGGEKPGEVAGVAGGAPGTPGKRKRRRRRKKKPAGEAGAAPVGEGGAPTGEGSHQGEGDAEGQPGAEAKEGDASRRDRPGKKKDRPREPRERPAFNMGDIVFGKITEITDDALLIDLSGKALAIFDRRELDLPDDIEYGSDPEEMDEEPVPAGHSGENEPRELGAQVAGDGTDAAAAGPAEPTAAVSADSQTNTAAVAATDVAASLDSSAEAHVAAAEPAEPVQPTASVDASHESAEKAEGGTEAAPAATPQTDFPIVKLEVGAPFVGIVHNDGGRGGLVVLTRHPKRVQRAKLVTGGAFKEKGEILGLVTGIIKGGVEVDIDGLRAFAPGSHMDLRLGVDLHPILGKRLLFVVTQYAKRGKDVVLSRKPFLEAEAKIIREQALKTLQVGSVVEGTVRSVVGFGAFIDVGGVEGLVPLSEMSHNRGDGPHDVFKVGEKTPVKILKVDERGKVWLSHKAAIPDPWLEVAKKYPMGTKLTGKVARLQPFGVFVELEPGIDGLIHTADLSLKRIEHPSEVVKEGDSIEVVVVHLEIGAHKIGLHPAPTGDAANELPQRIILNKPVKVAVVGYEGAGLVVRVLGATGRHARGFIGPAATGTPRGTDMRREFPLGKQLDAKVTEMDPRKGELKLSVKALSEDTERTAYRQYREQVTREAKFGTLGDLLKKNVQK